MSTIYDDPVQFRGPVNMSGAFYPPAASVKNATFSGDAADRLDAAKAVHQRAHGVELCAPGVNIAAITKLLHIVRGATATIVGIEAAITGAATTDRTASIDVQKSTGGAAFATILSSPILVQNGVAIRTPLPASISNAALVDGDILQAVVTLGGSGGTQPQGLLLTLNIREQPE